MNKQIRFTLNQFLEIKPIIWAFIWISGLSILWIWNYFFLNPPDFSLIRVAFLNTLFISFFVVFFSMLFGWIFSLTIHVLSSLRNMYFYSLFLFLINLIRSVPQIIGILILYFFITQIILNDIITNEYLIILSMSLSIAIFQFLEIMDLLLERINYFKKTDFFNALLVCGVKENTIINKEIFLKNSRIHILNKLISIFGSTIFLQCSVDFILSVGLSTQISSINFPVTLGNLLARIDSKQDILAIGHTIMNPTYAGNLPFEHLQGISIAFIIVFTLICIFKISNTITERIEA